jgi:hypothetical protein
VASFAEVSDILWRERELLDVLAFKLDQERLLLADGNVRWLARAAHEIELVIEQARLLELTRAVEVDALAQSIGLEPAPTLAELAAAAPPPWDELLEAHRRAFIELSRQIHDAARQNQRALDDAWHATQGAMCLLAAGEA